MTKKGQALDKCPKMATRLKIVVVGDPKVGKSALIQRYVPNNSDKVSDSLITDDHVDEELLADFLEKRVVVDEKELVVSIWDQPSSSLIPPRSFYSNAHACCLIFSTVDAQSLQKLEFWYDCFKNACGDRSKLPPLVIAENKIDLIDHSVVDSDEVERMARRYKVRLYRTSAKFGDQVDDLFEYVASKAAKYAGEEIVGDFDQRKLERTLSAGSWTSPDSSTDKATPSKRRTGGVKPIFNKNKCPVM